MQIIKHTKYIRIVLFTVVILLLNGCNYIISNDTKEEQTKLVQQKNVAINIEEAQLLVKVAKTNSDIITLSTLFKEKEDSVSIVASKLQKNHLSIAKDLTTIAEEKLILIPDTTFKTEVQFSNTKNDNFSVTKYLETVSNLLENQIVILNKLENETTDKDFIELSVDTKKKLKEHLTETKTVLNKS